MITIYALADPATKQIRYVGLTRDIKRRLRQHRQAKSSNNHLNNWMRKVCTPMVLTLIEVDLPGLADKMERFFIASYRRSGSDLLNLTEGGESAFGHTEESKRKLSEARRSRTGYKLTESHKLAIGMALKGRPNPNPKGFVEWNKSRKGIHLSEEVKAKMSAARKGRKRPLHVREAVSRAAKLRWENPEYRSNRTRLSKITLDLHRAEAQLKSAEVRRPRKLASLKKVSEQIELGYSSARVIARNLGMGKTYVQELMNELKDSGTRPTVVES